MTIGDISKLPQACIDELNKSIDETKDNTGLVLSLALNYGSRADIKSAVTRIAKMVEEGKISIDDIDDEMISSSMSTRNIVDPDLVIRTSGEQRLSNFLLWEVAYSEFYFTDKHWPDFDEEALQEAIYNYQARDRRFGNVK